MDEIVRMVAQKTGISEEQARTATTTVIDFIKQRLPAPLASQVDSVIGGSGTTGTQQGPGDIAGNLGGIFGKKD